MDENNQKILQKIVGNFLYCARVIYPTMLMALKSLEVVQKKTRIETAKQITKFINFSATYPDAVTEHIKIRMIPRLYLDASCIL